MKYFIFFLSGLMLAGCSFGGFQPPKRHFVWYLHNKEKLIPSSDPESLIKYIDRREKDMRACGIDPVIAESDSAKANLCLEKKGWYLKSGPVCEDSIVYNDPLCVKWRAEHKR